MEAARQARERADAARQEREAVAAQQLTAARVGHRKAVEQLRPRTQRLREAEAEISAAQREKLERRAAAILALKTSTEAAQAKLQGANQRRAEKRRTLERARESEKNEILSAGGNPYQVFREREERARLRVEQRKIQEQLAANMEAMQQRMLYQARQESKRREEERRNKEAEVAAALAVTALGAQQKDSNFMTRVTKSHSSVLDPTSQIKNLHPSKHTTIKDWKFGLGLGKDPDIIDMMASKYPSVARDFGDPEAEVKAQIEAESRRGPPRWK